MLVIIGFESPHLGVVRTDNPIAEFQITLHRRAFPGKGEGSEVVHRVRSQLCPFVAAGLSMMITLSKPAANLFPPCRPNRTHSIKTGDFRTTFGEVRPDEDFELKEKESKEKNSRQREETNEP